MDFNPHAQRKPRSDAAVDKKLCKACKQGKIDKVREALAEGANVDCRVTMALSEDIPLFLCVKKGYTEIARLLIEEHGASLVETITFDGTTVLHWCALYNRVDILKQCLAGKCDVNVKSKLCRTPLMQAAQLGYVDLCQALLDNDASADIVDKDNQTALSYAVDHMTTKWKSGKGVGSRFGRTGRHYDTMKLLVNVTSDVNVTGCFERGVTVLHCAARELDLEFVKYLINEKKANLFAADHDGRLPIHWAQAAAGLVDESGYTSAGSAASSTASADQTGALTEPLSSSSKQGVELVEFLRGRMLSEHSRQNGSAATAAGAGGRPSEDEGVCSQCVIL